MKETMTIKLKGKWWSRHFGDMRIDFDLEVPVRPLVVLASVLSSNPHRGDFVDYNIKRMLQSNNEPSNKEDKKN